jgi:CelD/BcsL family acetyltransferase involved in cellulose biosynthesis
LTAARDCTLDLVTTEAAFRSLRPEWEALYGRVEPRNPFQGWAWNAACRRHLCPASDLFVLTARRAGELAGVAPLRLDRRGPFRVLRFIGDGRTDYPGFLSEDASIEAALIRELEERRSAWDLAVLRQLTDDYTGIHAAACPSGLRSRGVHGTVSPYLAMGEDWDRLVAEGPQSLRRAKRAARKFEKDGHVVERITDGADRFVEEAAEVEARSWKGRDGCTRFQPGPGQELLREVFGELGLRGEMEAWIARVEGKPIAFLLNFLTGRQVWYYQGAYDEEHRKLYAGMVLHYRAVERAWQQGIREYDFLSGDEAYKFDWTNGARELRYRALFPAGARGVLAYYSLIAPRWALKDHQRVRSVHQALIRLKNNPAQLLPEMPPLRARAKG